MQQPNSLHSRGASGASSARGRFLQQRRRSSRQASVSDIEASQPDATTTSGPAPTSDQACPAPQQETAHEIAASPQRPQRGRGSAHVGRENGAGTIHPKASNRPSSSSATLLQGRIIYLNVPSGFGFLTPVTNTPHEDKLPVNQATSSHQVFPSPGVADAHIELCSPSSSQTQEIVRVYFKLPPTKLDAHSSCYSGLMNLQVGDTLKFLSDLGVNRPHAIYTRLIDCSLRSCNDMASYLKYLLFQCLEDGHIDIILHEVTRAPKGLLLILEHGDPDRALILLILRLAIAICNHCKGSSFNTSRFKEFFRLLIRTAFFKTENGGVCRLLRRVQFPSASGNPLKGFSAIIEREWGEPLHTLVMSIKSVILQVLSHIPEELPFLVCLIQILDQMQVVDLLQENNSKALINSECSFAMQVIQHVTHASSVQLGLIIVSYDKLPLTPSALEIKTFLTHNNTSSSTGLPVAKAKGAYDSAEEYIETYFRLLREDSVGQLLKGISDFHKEKLDCRDMTMWFGVSATGVHFQQYLPGLTVGLHLHHDQANRRRPKLPLPGSLLCICDNGGSFENPMWAIAARTAETSSKKTSVLFVEVLEGTPAVALERFRSTSPWGRIIQASSMVVAESPAYYRAYEPVLKALQRLNPETMPFQSELVMATSPSYKSPNYLTETTILDWKCLSTQDAYGDHKAGVHELLQPTLSGFQTCLDSSQVDAVNHVLQNRLAMIQGPPGTGKSFLSVRILELLLSANTRPQKPVLIVTYKNRALDQLLASCLRFCEPEELVRVGGRSTDEKLACCNLQYLLKTAERKSTSDWIANCKKLEDLQTEMVVELQKLYRCQAFNMAPSISSLFSSPRFLKGSQARTEKGQLADISKRTSSESSSDVISKDPDASDFPKKQHKLFREWIPSKAVFDTVKRHFASDLTTQERLRGQALKGKSTAEDDGEDLNGSEEDDEERNESENLWQDINSASQPRSKGKVETDWIRSSKYINFKDIDLQNEIFTSQFLGTFDLTQYTWLLEEDPWGLSEELRCFLMLVIMKQNLNSCIAEFLRLRSEYDAVCTDNAKINKDKRVAILKEAKIIGMTTTGAAINQDIIAAISPSIILVEESGEILEPHLMALLSPDVEHLILVGDHKQLRPPVACYQLETRHNLGISMLERLAGYNNLPYQTLHLQSRMREEFLQLIKPIYPALGSNLKVVNGSRNQPAICMASTMYFWNHALEETTGRSPSNIREAHMVVALSKWLLSEGHKHEEITVICAYSGQVSLVRKMLDKTKGQNDDAIEVQTIDRYQGSENRIVIVSLVRSNEQGKAGYLTSQNRLCVSVSRARAGLYICGNAETLSHNSPHWRTLIGCLRNQNLVGEKLSLVCPRHPNSPQIELHHDQAEGFSPNVCAVACNATLSCGHLCTQTCHYGKHALCKRPVQHVFPSCQHSTRKLCSDPDTNLKCLEKVWIKIMKCGHPKRCECWENTGNIASKVMCTFRCRLTLSCMHPCTLLCGQDCCSKPCPACAHIEMIKAKKERELQMKQLKEKLSEIDREIEKLKTEPEVGPIFKELRPSGETAPEYLMVQDRTEKFIQPTHKSLPVVTRIEKIINMQLELKYLQAKRELTDVVAPPQLLFHGTDDAGIEGITTNGFRLPSASKNNMFGVGCYFATDSSKSAQHLYTKGSNKLLLCDVLLGRPWSVNSAKPDLTLKKVRDKEYDSVFSMRNSRDSGGTEFDEYIIYNPSQAIPRYVIHYQNMDCCTPELPRLFQHAPDSKFGRRILNANASSAVTGMTSDEMHFRYAESQFFRMCTDRKAKVEKVELTWNKDLEESYRTRKQQFEKEKKPGNELWVFHGTTKENIDKIVKEGFKVGGQGVPIRCGAVYGSGVYTAANPEISIPYSSASQMMLLATAICGKTNEDYNVGATPDVFVLK